MDGKRGQNLLKVEGRNGRLLGPKGQIWVFINEHSIIFFSSTFISSGGGAAGQIVCL